MKCDGEKKGRNLTFLSKLLTFTIHIPNGLVDDGTKGTKLECSEHKMKAIPGKNIAFNELKSATQFVGRYGRQLLVVKEAGWMDVDSEYRIVGAIFRVRLQAISNRYKASQDIPKNLQSKRESRYELVKKNSKKLGDRGLERAYIFAI